MKKETMFVKMLQIQKVLHVLNEFGNWSITCHLLYQSILLEKDDPDTSSKKRFKKLTELYLENIHKICSVAAEEIEGLNPIALYGHFPILKSLANTASVMQSVLFDVGGLRSEREEHNDIDVNIESLIHEVCSSLSTEKMSEFYYLIQEILLRHSENLCSLLSEFPNKALIFNNIAKARILCGSGIYTEDFKSKYLQDN